MAFSFSRFLKLFAWTLLKGLALVVLIAGGCVFILQQKTRAPYDWEVKNHASAAAVSGIKPSELQAIIAEVYGVETSRFIQPDILWITAPTSPDLQRTCEGIANLWAARSGLNYVCVESWNGTTRLARAKVQNGSVIE